MSTVKSFIKEVVARVAGDSAEIVAQKNYRKATSAIQSQIALLKAKEVDDEAAVETAKENLENKKYPVSLISNNSAYVSEIASANDLVERAEGTLEATRRSIKFFSDLLVEFDAEV